jgi:predicted permease
MLQILNALIPVFLVIALGWTIKRMDFLGDEIWAPLDKLTYYIFFPALLCRTLAVADLGPYDIGPMASALAAGLASMVVLLMVLK